MRMQARPRIQSIQARREGPGREIEVVMGSVEGKEKSNPHPNVERANVRMGYLEILVDLRVCAVF